MTGKLTYSLDAVNRIESYNNYQWYKKPNRGAGTGTTLDSNTAEDDTFAIFQLGWNTVVGGRLVRRHQAELQQHALPAVAKDRPAVDLGQLDQHPSAEFGEHRVDVPSPAAVHLELAVLGAGIPQGPARLPRRLRQRVHARGCDDVARRQRQPHLPQRARQRHSAAWSGAGHRLQLADDRRTRRDQHGSLRAGLLLVAAFDGDCRHPLGTCRRHDPAAVACLERVLPVGHHDLRVERHPEHGRHAHHLHRQRRIRPGEGIAAVERLGAAVQRHLRSDR